MKRTRSVVPLLLLAGAWMVLVDAGLVAQEGRGRGGDRGRFAPAGRGGVRFPGSRSLAVLQRFDWNGDGRLDEGERARARAYVKEKRGAGGRGGGPGGFGREEPTGEEGRAPERLTPDVVERYPDRPLYDPGILRTVFLEFSSAGWEAELADFYRTDVDVPADLVVDGARYASVGVRFRGNSSFFTVAAGKKRSLNISIDYGAPGRRLHGQRTVELLNGHADPSFLREVLFSHVARRYMPAPRANFVRLVINGESWGVYVNIEQYNKDFLADRFGTRQGVRWKVPANPRGAAGLRYLGDDVEAYRPHLQLKTTDDPDGAWKSLVDLARMLDGTPPERLEAALGPHLDIDRALWFIALDNVFMDGDGYISRGSDFAMYTDPAGRFHPLHRDSNETFGIPGGPGRRFESDVFERMAMDPLEGVDDRDRPLISRLLAVPGLRARYLAHVRTLVDEALDWSVLGPLVEQFHSVLGDAVAKDTRKLYATSSYEKAPVEDIERGRRSIPSLKRFVEQRREYLLSHPEMRKPTPVIDSVGTWSEVRSDSLAARDWAPEPETNAVRVHASVDGDVVVEKVLLYFSTNRFAPFETVEMKPAADGQWVGEIPAQPAGTRVRYYVEARTPAGIGTTTFHPRKAEALPLEYTVRPPLKSGFAVRIAEIMAENTTGLVDPRGRHGDWVRLRNTSGEEVDLSGLYLSDDLDEPRKWRIPQGTTVVPGGDLIVWADERSDRQGLHASFKLDIEGETVLLVDHDDRGNAILDRVDFGPQQADVSFFVPLGGDASSGTTEPAEPPAGDEKAGGEETSALPPLERALERAGENRRELERALAALDGARRESLEFLILNMPERDLRELSSGYLTENVNVAHDVMEKVRWAKDIPREVFLNDVLPYACVNERRDPWRRRLAETCLPIVADCRTPAEAAQRLNETLWSETGVKYSTRRSRADQSPFESMESGMASCTGLSILLADACRSVGVPARLVGVPSWVNKRGNHTWVEIWDGEWHFTGACEPDPRGLNHSWFQNDASLAIRDSRRNAIYASSFRKTETSFPLVWARDVDYVSAVNVTDRYTAGREDVPAKSRLLVRVIDRDGGERVAASVRVTEATDGAPAPATGTSRDESADTNDILAFELERGSSYVIEVEHAGRKARRECRLEKDQHVVTVALSRE